jgi:L-iditol 2-dehydrogenase
MVEMRAYRYFKDKQSRLERIPVPVLGEGGALVKLEACSICGTDVRTYRFGSAKIGEGRVMGHEFIGRILELAPDFSGGFGVGDWIGMAPAIGCGGCYSCKAGHTNMCDSLATMGFQYDGGFAEYTVIPRQAFLMGNVYKLPPAADPVIFALSEPLACVINAQSYLDIKSGEDVVIFGSGIIGCMHAELARAAGASVYLVEPAEERIRQVEGLLDGAARFIPGGKDGAAGEIAALTGGKGADVAVIACSVGAAQVDGMRSLAKCGRISLFGGLPGDGTGFLDSNLIHYRELGVFGVHASTPAQNRRAMELIRDGKFNAAKYITRRYPLADIEQAFHDAAEGAILKAVIVMN